MSLFPRFVTNDFTPMFRLLDGYADHVANTRSGWPNSSLATDFKAWRPKFDVKENKDNYELLGELPGIQQQDISIEFTDPHTLSIRGRTEETREEGTKPTAILEGDKQEPAKITEGGEQPTYQKASVEDENTAAKPEAAEAEKQEAQKEQPEQENATEQVTYWLSERSVGEFSRSFNFPDRVDTDHVTASLKNGILSIIVPKAAPPQAKRITVE